MTLYFRGCSGPEVKRLQIKLRNLGLYAGLIDGLFGGGTESAVRTFQRNRGILMDGKVGQETWAALFDGETIPVPQITKEPLEKRCLALTACFETGCMFPECFSCLTGDFDGQGISLGVLQWNFGQRSLQPLLKEMDSSHGDVLKGIFGESYNTLTEVLYKYSFRDQMAWVQSIQSARHDFYEPWKGLFKTLGRNEAFQDIQVKHSSEIFQRAMKLCREFGVWSERALALMFDVVVQNGSISSETRDKINLDLSRLAPNMTAEDLEVEKLRIVANRRAEVSRAQFREDVRQRKLCCANGKGNVHGTDYDLENQFGICLKSFS